MNGNHTTAPARLSELMDTLKREIMLELNCHHVAIVDSFDAEKLTIQAEIAYPKTIGGKLVTYPVPVDMPAFVAGGRLGRVTHPIAKGDPCLIAFNDRDIDNWFSSGNVRPLNTARAHSFADGIAFVGINSLADVVRNANWFGAYDNTRTRISYGKTSVGVGATKVILENELTTLGEQLDLVLVALDTFAVACESSADATLAAAATALHTAIATPLVGLRATLGGLLE